MPSSAKLQNFLSVDIGGSHIKAIILKRNGDTVRDYEKVPTPDPATPENLLKEIKSLIKNFPEFDCISAGFPGYIKEGVVYTAPNLGTDLWKGVNLQSLLKEQLGKDAIVVNDADMQGMGVVDGKGFEMVITLGTGFGTSFFKNGVLLPHLELAHHPITKSNTYDSYLGDRALEDIDVDKWNKRLKKVLNIIKTVFNYDSLYIGGGNSRKINFELDENIKIISNRDGIKGGPRLWLQDESALSK